MKSRILFLCVVPIVLVLSGCLNKSELLQLQDKPLSLKSGLVQDASLSLKSASLVRKYIVILKDDAIQPNSVGQTSSANVRAKATGILVNNQFSGAIEEVYQTALQGFTVRMSPDQAQKLISGGTVKSVEADQVISLSPIDAKCRPGSKSDDNMVPWGIFRVGGSGSGIGKTAWIIDTGIDKNHRDLKVDLKRSVSFVGSNTSPWDEYGHGTHVAGIIGAQNNKIGVVGVAAGATLVSVRVLDRNGTGTVSGLIAGIDYVAANGKTGDVANLSLGGGASLALDNAVIAASAKVRFVLAAGNSSDNTNNYSPARANGPNIYTVSAMDSRDRWASWSNYGNPPIDYCAPGVDIYSTYMGGGYAIMSGTSMAAPHVTGLLLRGAIKSDGRVRGDPDKNADLIAFHK